MVQVGPVISVSDVRATTSDRVGGGGVVGVESPSVLATLQSLLWIFSQTSIQECVVHEGLQHFPNEM